MCAVLELKVNEFTFENAWAGEAVTVRSEINRIKTRAIALLWREIFTRKRVNECDISCILRFSETI
jgi:hypothetical protein